MMRRALAILLLSMATFGSAATTPLVARADIPPAPGSIKPAITWKKIPFGAKRKHQMAAYSKRHYGARTWRLTGPKVIIEHYTDGTSFDSAWNYFSRDGKHLGEYPGVCAHFIIDTDGTVYQLVNLGIRCRHAIGMNWTAIGIEHVGTSDRQILRNHAMMRASLHLTVWLMLKYGISWGNVIGHAETLQSPYHHELYRSWRCSTHSDWLRRDMNVYRKRLKRQARRESVPIGSRPHWVDNGC
jgi:N-acetylmuramoyl-L-alanine amidase